MKMVECFKDGAEWNCNHALKDAQGKYLPEIGREVIAFIQDQDDAWITKVVFAHRPDTKGWYGKSISTGVVEHYTPKTYGNGGWNIPNVKYWLDYDINELLCI